MQRLRSEKETGRSRSRGTGGSEAMSEVWSKTCPRIIKSSGSAFCSSVRVRSLQTAQALSGSSLGEPVFPAVWEVSGYLGNHVLSKALVLDVFLSLAGPEPLRLCPLRPHPGSPGLPRRRWTRGAVMLDPRLELDPRRCPRSWNRDNLPGPLCSSVAALV